MVVEKCHFGKIQFVNMATFEGKKNKLSIPIYLL